MEQPPTQVVEIAANLDDASGEMIGAAVESLLGEGALDAWTTPIGMKKNRPGVMVSLLCAPTDRDRLAHRLMELTGTFGVRLRDWDRCILERRHETVRTDFGPIRVKVGTLEGMTLAVKAEFEDVASAARKHGVTPRQVLDAVARSPRP
jgi:pyridinium-3,5-bisthiocarboxylic acid mononucleotide nickel chelatase